MSHRRELWLLLSAALSAACQSDPFMGLPSEPHPFSDTTQMSASTAGGPDAAVDDAAIKPSQPDAALPVLATCRPAVAQPGPARSAIMMDGAGSATPGSDAEQFTVDKLYGSFTDTCGTCHSQPTTLMGNLLVTSLDTFKTNVSEAALERLHSTKVGVGGVMPPGRLLSERDPNDSVVRFAKRLDAWLKAGKPDSFADPVADAAAPTTPVPPAQDGPPYAVSKALGSALTNLGSCIPTAPLVGSLTEPMDALDAKFAQMERFEDLPKKLSETDLVTLDSERLAMQGVLSFAPAYTLWADDAHKMRYVRVPRGESIKFSVATQDFDIPENTRFYKTFLKEVKDLDGNVGYRKIETRLIVARKAVEHSDNPLPEIKALFGTYQWNDDESEATLVAEPYQDGQGFKDTIIDYVKDEAIDAMVTEQMKTNAYLDPFKAGGRHHYAIPGSDRCAQCHMGQSSFALGFLPLQIKRRPMGEGGVIEPAADDELNQLERFIDYGIITGITKDQIATKLLPLEKSQGARSPRNDYELTAQGYMLGNCAHCHNPKGYTSRTAPALKDLLNFLPSAKGGGVFEFPLDRVSPRITRVLPISVGGVDSQLTVDVPYITPSLYEFGAGPLAPYSWASLYDDATKTSIEPPTKAPWRSLIYRNVQNAFVYSDRTAIFPHMPMNTAGYDCRVPNIMAEWMLSVPSFALEIQTGKIKEKDDNRPQPFTEVPRGDPRYQAAVALAEQRLAIYHNDPVYKDCKASPDIVDANAASLDPLKWNNSVLQTETNPDFPLHIPSRSHWVSLDSHPKAGDWAPRNPTWQDVIVKGDFAKITDQTKKEAQQALQPLLRSMHRDDEFKTFATTEVPFGVWLKKPECKFDGVKTASSYAPDPRWTWLSRAGSPKPDDPIYTQAPGAAIFGMICVNCHGATFQADGRQAGVVSDITGGRVTVANFRGGLFGPVTSPGQARTRVFAAADPSSSDTVDDWSARYMAWMALGGTLAPLPQAVLQMVGNTPVFGKTIQRGVSGTANMLEVAKVVCSAILPTRDGAQGSRYRYSKSVGDWDLWRSVCSFRNLSPIRAYRLAGSDAADVDGYKDREDPSVFLFARTAANSPAGAQFYDAYDGKLKVGVGPEVREPECVMPSSPNDADKVAKFHVAYDAASGDPKRRPLCPPGMSLEDLSVTTKLTPLSTAQEQEWVVRGAINAGFAVFSYIEATTQPGAKPKPAYDNCEALAGTATTP